MGGERATVQETEVRSMTGIDKRVAGVESTTGGPESAVSNFRGPPSPPPPWETTKYGMFSVNG